MPNWSEFWSDLIGRIICPDYFGESSAKESSDFDLGFSLTYCDAKISVLIDFDVNDYYSVYVNGNAKVEFVEIWFYGYELIVKFCFASGMIREYYGLGAL